MKKCFLSPWWFKQGYRRHKLLAPWSLRKEWLASCWLISGFVVESSIDCFISAVLFLICSHRTSDSSHTLPWRWGLIRGRRYSDTINYRVYSKVVPIFYHRYGKYMSSGKWCRLMVGFDCKRGTHKLVQVGGGMRDGQWSKVCPGPLASAPFGSSGSSACFFQFWSSSLRFYSPPVYWIWWNVKHVWFRIIVLLVQVRRSLPQVRCYSLRVKYSVVSRFLWVQPPLIYRVWKWKR